MEQQFFLFCLMFTLLVAAPQNRRQVLPPIPGYIPVYIQHGDVPPEDPFEYSHIFYTGDKNIPPYLSVTNGELFSINNNLQSNDILSFQKQESEKYVKNVDTEKVSHSLQKEAIQDAVLDRNINTNNSQDNNSTVTLHKTKTTEISTAVANNNN